MATKVMNGLDLLGQRVQNVGDPSTATDAANRQYVDNVARGLAWKDTVRAASTGNVSLTAPGGTLDGVTLAANDRVLLKNQTAGAENGIYVWTAAASALTRANDADNGTELKAGTAVTITEGTVNGDKVYMIISDGPVTIGTTATTWGQFGGGQTYTASTGATMVGNDIRGVVKSGGGLIVDATGFSIDTSIVVRKVSGNMGNGSSTSIAVTHGLGTKDVEVQVRETATDTAVLPDWVATDVNTVTFMFGATPASNAYRFTIMG